MPRRFYRLVNFLKHMHYSTILIIIGIALFPTAIAIMKKGLLPANAVGVLLGTGIAL